MNIGELFVSLGFDVDDKKLVDFNNTLKAGLGDMLKLSAAAAGGVYALNAFMESSINNAVALRNFTNQTGFSSEALQRWQAVVHYTNPAIGVEQAAASYRKLAQALIEIRQGGGPSGALAQLGVSFRADMKPEEAVEQIRRHLAETIANRGRAVTGDLLEKVGLGAGSLNALSLSEGEYNSIGDRFSVSQENLDRLAKVADAMAKIDLEWGKFKADLIADWAEPLVKGMEKADEAMKEFLNNLQAIARDWRGWPEAAKIASEALGVLLAALLAINIPLGGTVLALGAIAFAINDIGRATRGLPTYTGSAVSATGDWVLEQLKGAAQWAGNVNREHASQRTLNLTQNIHSTGSSKDVAEEVVRRVMQQEHNLAFSGLNLGQVF